MIVRPLARAISRPLSSALTGLVSGLSPEQQVRNLFASNGGDFDGTQLDFGKASALWQDASATTPAEDGDPLGRVDDISGQGNNATQTLSASQPTSTTDALGTRVASTDGGDDYMTLPDGTLGDGTQAISVSFAIAPNATDSDTSARLFECSGGANPMIAFLDSGKITFRIQESGDGSTRTASYALPTTDNAPFVVTFQWAPNTGHSIRVNGALVAQDTTTLAALNDPGSVEIFGNGTANNLASLCNGCVALTGTSLPTSAQTTTVESYLAGLAGDTLYGANAATVVQRLADSAAIPTDLNVSDPFTASQVDDASIGSSSITIADGVSITFNVVGGDQARADILFRTRPGYLYRLAPDSNGDAVTVRADPDAFGGTGYANATAAGGATADFVATSSYAYVRAFSVVDATTLDSLSITEIPATAAYWDFNPARMYSDDGTTLAVANDPVYRVDARVGDYPLKQVTESKRPVLDATGTFLDFDAAAAQGFQVTDSGGDFVLTGGMTVVAVVNVTNTAAIKTVAASGDSTIATDTAYQASIDASELLSWEQADAANTETQTSANGPTAATDTTIAWKRDGAVVTYIDDITTVDSDTFATVTSPTAGTSPATYVGLHVDGASEPFDGSEKELVILDRPLSFGLMIHLNRAIKETIS